MESEILEKIFSELIEVDLSELELKFTTESIAQKEERNEFTCFYCFKKFGCQTDMLDHIELEHFTFVCDKCDKKYPTDQALRKHKKNSHLAGKFKCPLCDRAFTRKDHCKDHVYTHSEEPLFRCKYDECNKVFRQSITLKQHERIHTRIYRKTCPICKENVVYLAKHLRTHLETKEHQCSSCDKSFSRRCYLVEHEKIHQGKVLFTCDECKLEFKTSNGFYKHKRSKHNAERYICEIPECKQQFNRKDNMTSHMRRMHKLIVETVDATIVH